MTSDFEALQRWRAGDLSAGDALFREHAKSVYRFFSSQVDGSVDDLVQETFERCLQSSASFREDGGFRSWMFGVARHVLGDHLRKQYRGREDFDLSVHSVIDSGTTPSRAVGRRREYQLLLAAMQRLPVDQQIALELYYWEGMSGSKIATVLECPEGTVRTHLRRGRLRLKEELTQAAESPEQANAMLAELERSADAAASADA